MKWLIVRPGHDPTQWHRWFAWHPVEIEGYWHWLEFVNRREYLDPYWPVELQTGWQHEAIIHAD